MSPIDRVLLTRLMVAMATDRAQVVPFLDAFGDKLAGVVRGVLRDFGRRDLIRDDDEVHGLAIDAAFVIQSRAGSWDSDGAVPWNWARLAIRHEIAVNIGHALSDDDVDEHVEAGPAGPTSGSDSAVDFDDLADRYPEIGLLRRGLEVVGVSERDRTVFVEYRIQSSLGDPSPAHTVADIAGVSPANARQIDCRVRRRLKDLVETGDNYRALRGFPWIYPGQSRPATSEGNAA